MSKLIKPQKDFKFKHSLGQNFLTDTNLLRAIVADSGVDNFDNVLEIGAGAGALTRELASVAKKVVSVEVDRSLMPTLDALVAQHSNLSVVYADILRLKVEDIADFFDGEPFHVVANLPYYITTPIIFYLLESTLPVQSITIMVQAEVADRIVANPGTKDYGAITPILQLYGQSKITRRVDRRMFTPAPNVDSAVVHLDVSKSDLTLILAISRFIRHCFTMRRKTLINNLMHEYNINRTELENILVECDIPIGIRAEALTLPEFQKLFNNIKRYYTN